MASRAARKSATRDQIVEAAIQLYAELGISATTMREVGIRADVAPGTLRNHFPSRDLLDAAMVERLRAEAPVPELTVFDGADTIERRLERLVRATGPFLDRAERLYRMWLREPMLSGAWTEAGAAYGAAWDQLMSVALGELADDRDAGAVLRAVLQPAFFEGVRAGDRTTEQVCDLITQVIVPWFTARSEHRHRAAEAPI